MDRERERSGLVEFVFVVHRREVTESAVEPLTVVKDFDPLEDRRAGVGTGGTVMGVAQHLAERFGAGIAAYPLEPANSPTLRTGHKIGRHRIQGISDEFVPSIVKLSTLGRILDVWDGDAIVMAQRLAGELGIAVGISSGANLLGALEIAHEQGDDACVATVFCDDNKKYLSTDLCSDEECKEHYRCNEVELLGFQVIPHVEERTHDPMF